MGGIGESKKGQMRLNPHKRPSCCYGNEKVSKGSATVRCHSDRKNYSPHVAGSSYEKADSLLQRSKERGIASRRERETDEAVQRGEGSWREVNRHEWAGSDEKPGAQMRERGLEDGAPSATLPHSWSGGGDRQRQYGLWHKRINEAVIQAWQAKRSISGSLH